MDKPGRGEDSGRGEGEDARRGNDTDLLTLHSQPIWYLWFRLFFWVMLSVSQGTIKSQRVMYILPSPSAFPVGTVTRSMSNKTCPSAFLLHLGTALCVESGL